MEDWLVHFLLGSPHAFSFLIYWLDAEDPVEVLTEHQNKWKEPGSPNDCIILGNIIVNASVLLDEINI